MNLLRCTALTLALVGCQSALAEEPADAASETTLWTDYAEESSLLPQLESVLRSLRARYELPESPVEVETVNVDASVAERELYANDGNCALRPRPGSRIMVERCFYETPQERAFNQWIYQEEIKQIRAQHDQQFLEEARYGRAYRESLREGPSLR